MVSYMSLFFSTAIILDLFYMLKNPFSSTEERVKKFTVMAVCLSIVFSAVGLRLTLSRAEHLGDLNLYLFLTISVLNIVLGIVTMVVVFVAFRNKGMSQTVKK